MKRPNIAYLRGILTYQSHKGVFVWRTNALKRVRKGDTAGTKSLDKKGKKRIVIGINGQRYLAHRLAFVFMTGKWPSVKLDVDHKDGDGWNNKWKNLRMATRSQNICNKHRRRSDNTSGITGVGWDSKYNKWWARITVNGRIIHLGRFRKEDFKTAVEVRRAAEVRYFGAYAPSK